MAADPSVKSLRRNSLNLLLIVVSPPFLVPQFLQAARSLRAVRALRLLRLARLGIVAGVAFRYSRQFLTHRKFHYVAIVVVGVVLLGALGIYTTEVGTNASIRTFADALWWSVVTATTVGYGDLSPQTPEGRLIAVVLMFTGIGVIGVFTATVASFFLHHDDRPTAEMTEMAARLEAIEQKLDLLLSQRAADEQEVGARRLGLGSAEPRPTGGAEPLGIKRRIDRDS